VILFDVLSVEHLERIGELLWSGPGGPAPFLVGSSGIESALVAHWRQQGWLDAPPARPGGPEAPFQLVLSGSCSMATMAQVEYARERGYVPIRLPSDAAGPGSGSVEHIADEALKAMDRGQSAVVFSALGPAECDDATIAAGVGEALAEVGARIVARARPPRLVVAGGDTSGRVATRLSIDSLRFLAPIAPGAPLCRARSRDPRTDGLEVCLKGGQIGGASYFEQVRMGRA
ncbi:MAG: four-carbon acid sugar kinase family protein, partial [Chloroflexi bacterium]|nr:four-carbon acid sugar kinase family protein [Chloroflexota bacterium]